MIFIENKYQKYLFINKTFVSKSESKIHLLCDNFQYKGCNVTKSRLLKAQRGKIKFNYTTFIINFLYYL